MAPGEIVKVIETHFGVGDYGKTHILYPGVEGLVIENYYDIETLLLLISGSLIEVEEQAVEICNEENR